MPVPIWERKNSMSFHSPIWLMTRYNRPALVQPAANLALEARRPKRKARTVTSDVHLLDEDAGSVRIGSGLMASRESPKTTASSYLDMISGHVPIPMHGSFVYFMPNRDLTEQEIHHLSLGPVNTNTLAGLYGLSTGNFTFAKLQFAAMSDGEKAALIFGLGPSFPLFVLDTGMAPHPRVFPFPHNTRNVTAEDLNSFFDYMGIFKTQLDPSTGDSKQDNLPRPIELGTSGILDMDDPIIRAYCNASSTIRESQPHSRPTPYTPSIGNEHNNAAEACVAELKALFRGEDIPRSVLEVRDNSDKLMVSGADIAMVAKIIGFHIGVALCFGFVMVVVCKISKLVSRKRAESAERRTLRVLEPGHEMNEVI